MRQLDEKLERGEDHFRNSSSAGTQGAVAPSEGASHGGRSHHP